eukprot:scpid108143/ scgid30056/ 
MTNALEVIAASIMWIDWYGTCTGRWHGRQVCICSVDHGQRKQLITNDYHLVAKCLHQCFQSFIAHGNEHGGDWSRALHMCRKIPTAPLSQCCVGSRAPVAQRHSSPATYDYECLAGQTVFAEFQFWNG